MKKNIFASFFNTIKKILFGDDPDTSEENTNNEEVDNMTVPTKKAICIGINNYPGVSNDLRGCVNDATDYRDIFLQDYGFKEVSVLLDKKATRKNVIFKWNKLILAAKAGDLIVFTYSGHGTHTKDKNKDEADGRDEAICLYDGLLIDDEIRAIFNKKAEGVKLVFISDSCHSGTVSRSFINSVTDDSFYSAPRYMPPEDDMKAVEMATSPLASKSIFAPTEDDMNHILITGCLPTEYSYDARLGGRFNGAMTYNLIKILKANPHLTYKELYELLRKRLPSRQYPQTPQLEGKTKAKNQKVFS